MSELRRTVIMNKIKNKRYLLAIILFLYIFNPRFVKFDLRKVVDVLGLILIIIEIYNSNWQININAKIKRIIYPFMIFLIYQCANVVYRFIITGNDVYIKEYGVLLTYLIRTFLIVWATVIYMRKNRLHYRDFTISLALCTIFQFICVITSLLVSGIRNIFLFWNIKNSVSENIVTYSQYVSNHGYGLCENLYDSFGYIIALLICIYFIRSIETGRIGSIVLSFLFLLMPAVNSRTGLVFCCVGMFITILFYWKKIFVKKIAKFLIVLCIVIMFLGMAVKFIPEETISWVNLGYLDIMNLLNSGEKTGFFSAIMEGITYPSNLFIGAGASPDVLGGVHTDIGYIQCVWRYGIIGTVIFLLSYLNVFVYTYRLSKYNAQVKCFILCAASIFYLYLYKLYGLGNMGANLIIFTHVGFWVSSDNRFDIYKEKV